MFDNFPSSGTADKCATLLLGNAPERPCGSGARDQVQQPTRRLRSVLGGLGAPVALSVHPPWHVHRAPQSQASLPHSPQGTSKTHLAVVFGRARLARSGKPADLGEAANAQDNCGAWILRVRQDGDICVSKKVTKTVVVTAESTLHSRPARCSARAPPAPRCSLAAPRPPAPTAGTRWSGLP